MTPPKTTAVAEVGKLAAEAEQAVAATKELSGHIDSLTQKLEAERRWRRWAKWYAGILTVALLAFFAAAFTVVLQNRRITSQEECSTRSALIETLSALIPPGHPAVVLPATRNCPALRTRPAATVRGSASQPGATTTVITQAPDVIRVAPLEPVIRIEPSPVIIERGSATTSTTGPRPTTTTTRPPPTTTTTTCHHLIANVCQP